MDPLDDPYPVREKGDIFKRVAAGFKFNFRKSGDSGKTAEPAGVKKRP
jgi:hypothetical protein